MTLTHATYQQLHAAAAAYIYSLVGHQADMQKEQDKKAGDLEAWMDRERLQSEQLEIIRRILAEPCFVPDREAQQSPIVRDILNMRGMNSLLTKQRDEWSRRFAQAEKKSLRLSKKLAKMQKKPFDRQIS